MIDIHTHAGRAKEGPALILHDGVTGFVDAGSGGADNIDQVAAVARAAPQIGRVLVNISRRGVLSPDGELHDLNLADVALARGAIARNRDVVVGVKARLSDNVADANDLEALRRAQERLAHPTNCNIAPGCRRSARYPAPLLLPLSSPAFAAGGAPPGHRGLALRASDVI